MVMVNFFGHLSFFIFTGQKCLPGWYVAKKCPMVPISKRGWVGVGKIYLIEQCQNRKKALFIKVASFNNAVPCKPSSFQTQFVIVKVPMKNELMSSPLDHLKGRANFHVISNELQNNQQPEICMEFRVLEAGELLH